MIIEKRVSVIVMLTDLRDDETRDIGNGISLKHVSSSYQGVFQTRKVE